MEQVDPNQESKAAEPAPQKEAAPDESGQRYWWLIGTMIILGICILTGLKLVYDVFNVNNNLLKEELTLSREMNRQISELKGALIDARPKGQPNAGAERKEPPQPGTKKVEGVTQGSNPIKGDTAAPILLVQFSDFECPFSKKFYKETLPQLEKEYISKGKVKFFYRDFALPFHAQAEPAAIAVRCAGKQGKYWEMFEQLNNVEKLDAGSLSSCAKLAGVERNGFEACLKDPAVKEEVKKDAVEGLKLGVQGTPAFFINGRMIEGAYPFEVFKTVIENELGGESNKAPCQRSAKPQK